MGSGFARGAHARGKRIAFGNGQKIIWNHLSEPIFRNNPNIAPPGSERDKDIEWHPYCRGNRIYLKATQGRWVWDLSFRAPRGEMFFSEEEQEFGRQFGSGFIVVEPNVMESKQFAHNKQWPFERYESVVQTLVKDGHEFVQFEYETRREIPQARRIQTPSIRHALAVLQHAKLYLGAEGGLHHGAAALGVSAVVLFGGFVPPSVTGYEGHANISVGETGCGTFTRCDHCIAAMASISVDRVYQAAREKLSGSADHAS